MAVKRNSWGEKNLRISNEIAVYFRNGTRQAHRYYGSLIGLNGRSVSVSTALSDLERRDARANFFLVNLCKYAHTV